MKKFALLVFAIGLLKTSLAQYQAPVSGSQPNSFSLLPDNLGFLSSSVNQFTGQVQFSLPIMKLSGRGNLGYSFALNYSSTNLSYSVGTWNREAPTGVLGLGWSFDQPKIVVDHKGTTTRVDDDFYLVENGSSNQLIYNGTGTYNNGSGSYYTKNYMDWSIQYDFTNEKWTITKEDGTVYTYGDKNSGRYTLQYMVRWGNWIGNSSQPTGQQQMAYTWNLSEIKNLWSDKITFTYIQDLEYVAAGSGTTITTEKMHTKASYLSEIKNLNNEKISFSYLAKTYDPSSILEYQDPHTEADEPDAYQEKYESKFLDKVTRYDENGSELFHVQFGYNPFIGSLEMAKRVLTSITQVNSQGHSLPGYVFGYETGTTSTVNTGALKSVQAPTKGTISFSYQQLQLTGTGTAYTLNTTTSSNGTYKEPQFFFGEDYMVVTRRNVPASGHADASQPVIMDVLTWEGGRWRNQNVFYNQTNPTTPLQPMHASAAAGAAFQNLTVTTGKDFFAIYSKDDKLLRIFKKNPNKMGDWMCYEVSLDLGGAPTLGTVSNYLFAGSKEGCYSSSPLYNNKLFYYDPSSSSMNNWSSILFPKVSDPGPQYFYSLANNYIIVHQDDANRDGDVLKFIFFYPSATNTPVYTSTTVTAGVGGTYGNSVWTGSNSYSLFQAAGQGNLGGPPLAKIYYWDEFYNVSLYNSGVSVDAYTFANNINNSTGVFTTPGTGYAFRFDGLNWISSGGMSNGGSPAFNSTDFSFDDDLIFRPTSCSAAATRVFDANTRTWINPPNAQLSSFSECDYPYLAGSNFILALGKIYFRGTDGKFSTSQYTPGGFNDTGTTRDGVAIYEYLEGGLDFIASVRDDKTASQIVVANVKNGQLTVDDYFGLSASHSDLYEYSTNYLNGSYLAPPQSCDNMMVTELEPVMSRMDASKFKIHRKTNGVFGYGYSPATGEVQTDDIMAFVVTSIVTNDNSQILTTSYEYNVDNASTDVSGSVPQFNRCRVKRGGNNYQGLTDSYFFNGLSPVELVANDIRAGMPLKASQYYPRFTGALYNKATYDWGNSQNNEIARTITDYDFYDFSTKAFLNKASYTRPTSSDEYELIGMNTGISLFYPGVSSLTGMTPGTYTGVSQASSSGIGRSALFSIVINSATSMGTVTVTAPGSNYKIGDTFTFNGSQFGSSGSGSIVFTVTGYVIDVVTKKTTLLNYSSTSTQLVSKSTLDASGSVVANENYKYYTDAYGTSSNLFGSTVWGSPFADGTGTKATRWKNWGSVPGPYQTFQWKSGASDFAGYWDPSVTVPNSNWKLLSTVNSMNSRGLAAEVVGADGIIESTIWHPTKPLVLAKVKNAPIAQCVYQGFEFWTGGNTNNVSPLVGNKYYSFPVNGVALYFNLGVNTTYKVSYWTRPNSTSNWSLVEDTFTDSQYNLQLPAGTDVDEIRIYPVDAYMVSYSYDSLGNLITSCDANNILSYTEYDEFNRPKLSRDEKRNILQYNTYNTKN